MLINYLKIAFRNLVRYKVYSAINIGGLAIGMAVAMLIGLWVYDELSFNKYHKNYDRIAQVMEDQFVNGERHTSETVPFPFINELNVNYKENFSRIVPSTHNSDHILAAGENRISRTGQFMGEEAPELFSLEMLAGTRAGLQEMQSVLLSESTARALFGKSDPMNRLVKIDTDKNVRVAGIYRDLPQNSRFHKVQFIGTWKYFLATNAYMSKKKWDNSALWIFVEIKPETSFETASAAIRDSKLNVIRHIDNMKDEVATNPEMWLNPMRNWHLYSDFVNGLPDSGPVQYVWLVSVIGFFVLLLACINFMNLSTARSEKRAKEVGVRKAIGSLRSQLVRQFFTESFLVVLVAFLIAVILVTGSLTWFNELSAKQMAIPWADAVFWFFCLGFICITGLLAGSYPAFYLTSFQPVKVLKGVSIQLGRFASLPRKVLVTMQFTVSITLVICTIIIYSQVQFAKSRPVGYSRELLMMVPMRTDDFTDKTEIIQSELKKTGMISEVALSQSPATGVWSSNTGFTWKGNDLGTDDFATLTVSPEYAEAVGWQFLAGRNFSKALASDSTGFVVNETAARLMGFEDGKINGIIGETVNWKSKWMTNDIQKQFRIVGVVKDMVMESPFEKIRPTVFFLFGDANWINIKIKKAVGAAAAIPKIEAVFKKLTPSTPFEYQFADQEYDAKFRAEERIGKLSGFFSFLAILISCLGLFGLASFVAEQRTKEIGIRKVLGASVANLWRMLSRDFVVLVLISAIISAPVSLFAMQKWLSQYDYQTEISWWIFVATGSGALFLTLATISYQAIRAALLDPVKSLSSE